MKPTKQQLEQIDYFIKKFSDIPRDKWIQGSYGFPGGEIHCALGHCGMYELGPGCHTKESTMLSDLFSDCIGCNVADVNDGNVETWDKGFPKDNIIFALFYMKEKVSQ